MSSRESRWAGGEGLRVGLMIAAVLLGPMLLRAVGLPPGVVLMLLFLVPMLMQGLGTVLYTLFTMPTTYPL
ncbi:hypothetical protein [Rothia kristinae]|uniref:hypothetical protein n=1 Tax=Rothia kristinae TaxID=37923 RepID=UPI0007378EF6|nr:hypothetical protein [Rothia kristinae]KTR74265.1 hypothetical protein SA14R_09650 [Rothia kristinae]